MKIIDYAKSPTANGYYVLIIADETPADMPTTCENLGELDNSAARIMPGSILITTDLSERYMMSENGAWKKMQDGSGGGGSAESDVFEVLISGRRNNLTGVNTWTLVSPTFEEIVSAYNSGKIVLLRTDTTSSLHAFGFVLNATSTTVTACCQWSAGSTSLLNISSTGITVDGNYNLINLTSGTAGQVLTRTASGTTWSDPAGGLPSAGTVGQILKMGTNGAEWANETKELPSTADAIEGQVLMLDSNLDPVWDFVPDTSPTRMLFEIYYDEDSGNYVSDNSFSDIENAINSGAQIMFGFKGIQGTTAVTASYFYFPAAEIRFYAPDQSMLQEICIASDDSITVTAHGLS